MSEPTMPDTIPDTLQATLERRRRFFSRPAPAGYAEEWAEILAAPPEHVIEGTGSMLAFRIGELELAIASRWVKAVTLPLSTCAVPHRHHTAFLGLAAFSGEIVPCCSLSRILGLAEAAPGRDARAVVLEERPGERWVLPVEAVLGVSTGELHDRTNTTAAFRLAPEWSASLFVNEQGQTLEVLRPETVFQRLQRATA